MRLFTAVCFDDETKNALSKLSEAAKRSAGGNFSRKENFHLTLVFIGETDRKNDIEKALSKIEFPAFEYEFKGTGTFEKGIFWAGVKRNKNLEELHKTVKNKLSEIGIETENRKFSPHITLARKFRPEKDFDPAALEELLPKGKKKAERISLMLSERVDGKLCYTEIFSKKLN